MELPINLFFILKGKIDLIEQTCCVKSSVNPFINQSNTNINNNINREVVKNNNFTPVKESPKDDRIDIESVQNKIQKETKSVGEKKDFHRDGVYNCLDSVLKEIVDFTLQKEVLMTVHKILNNITNNPTEDKFKNLKTTNKLYQKYIESYPSVFNFLKFVGFTYNSDNSNFEFRGNIEELKKILDRVDDYLLEKSNTILKIEFVTMDFNPYESSIHIVGGGLQPDEIKKAMNPTDYDELLRQEKGRREVLIY
jgi:hypothetical protein